MTKEINRNLSPEDAYDIVFTLYYHNYWHSFTDKEMGTLMSWVLESDFDFVCLYLYKQWMG
jgi:succinate dehydrogenase flavin-adding protein (antitoxin of CptAB toxin-antitoxin module)